MDAPDLMGYLDCQHRLRPEELQIRDEEPSRRLPETALHQRWSRGSPQPAPAPKLPFWARADPTMQQMAAKTTISTSSTDTDPSTKSPSPRATFEESLRLAPSSSTTVTPPPPPPPRSPVRSPAHGASGATKPRGGQAPRGMVASRINKPIRNRGQRKPAPSTSRRITRSSRPTKLYELDEHGRLMCRWNQSAATSSSRPRKVE